MEIITFILTIITCLLALIYYLLRRQQQKWPRLGVPSADHPHLLFGNVAGIGFKEHSCIVLQRLYLELKRRGLKLGGIMTFFQPSILVVDPEVTKSILVKDFNLFHDRGVFVDVVGDPLSGSLFSLEGAQWKPMRQKLTPTFTSGKMKYMFETVVDVAEQMRKFMAENFHREDLELTDVMQRYTIDVIGNVAFGVECNTLKNPESDFKKMGVKATRVDMERLFKFIVCGSFPTLSRKLGVKLVDADVEQFFMNLVQSTVLYRENSEVKRNDFMNLLLEIKNKGKLSTEPNSGGEGITMNEIAAQCFTFFTAGFDTSSTTMNFCLYELAKNPDVQDRLRREIEEALEKDDGELKYETMLGMDYLDRVVNETLRMYAPFDNLFRKSNAPYSPPGESYAIPPGTLFQIPIHAMHYDPDYFPNPTQFNPDRFLPEAIKSRPQFVFLPFGDGPRSCIGMRFALMQTKVGLVTLLRNFRFAVDPGRTPEHIEFNPKVIVLASRSGMYLKVEPVQS